MTIQKKLRLDNASLIYPASLSKKYASLYRMRVSLDERVEVATLQTALEHTVRRIPTFGRTLSRGSFWWYLTPLHKKPQVLPIQRLHEFSIRGNGGFLFRVSADGASIVLDIFHVLTDGGGAMTFLLTLTAEYLRLCYGTAIEYGGSILDCSEGPQPDEIADAFDAFSGKKGALEQNDLAYHIKGIEEPERTLHDVRLTMDGKQVHAAAGQRDATVTELLAAAEVWAAQEIWKSDRFHRHSAIKVSVPVDLRRIYGIRTMRNFSSYVNLGVNVRNGSYSFDEILRLVSRQKRLYCEKSELESKVAANVQLEDNWAIASIPLFIKKRAIDIINRLKGDRYCTYTLSNIGSIELPDGMRKHVTDLDFMLGRQRGNTGASAAVSYGGRLQLNLTRRITGSEFESRLIECLHSLGLQIRVEEMDI